MYCFYFFEIGIRIKNIKHSAILHAAELKFFLIVFLKRQFSSLEIDLDMIFPSEVPRSMHIFWLKLCGVLKTAVPDS